MRFRRFQFRLRTLMIVVTLLSFPLGYVRSQVRLIQDRESAIDLIVKSHGGVTILDGLQVEKVRAKWGVKGDVPRLRRWLGDSHVHMIALPENFSWDEYRRIADLFPEAWVLPPESPSVTQP